MFVFRAGLVFVLCFGVVVGSTGCGPYHVRLDPPRPGITPDERVALFWRMRPTEEAYLKQNGEVVNRTIALGDRRAGVEPIEVVSPEDLEPLVGLHSETMRYARASIAAREKATIAGWTGLAATLVGVVVSGLFADEPPFGMTSAWIGAGVMVGGLIVLLPVQRHYARAELALRKRAFDTYPRDLGLLLNVCAHGTQVVPCEVPVDEAPLPSEQAPSAPPPPATTVPERTAQLRMR